MHEHRPFAYNRISERGLKGEGEICKEHLAGFSPDKSRALTMLETLTPGQNLTRESLIVLAKLFSHISRIQFPRDFTRQRSLVIKWFDDHLDELWPVRLLVEIELHKGRARVNSWDTTASGSDG
jgi:hypothetical protein